MDLNHRQNRAVQSGLEWSLIKTLLFNRDLHTHTSVVGNNWKVIITTVYFCKSMWLYGTSILQGRRFLKALQVSDNRNILHSICKTYIYFTIRVTYYLS